MSEKDLPALPAPARQIEVERGWFLSAYDADQMRAYARDAVAQRDEQIAKLTAEVESLRADAARYQWLKHRPDWLGWDADFRPDEVEREIDAARAEAKRNSNV